MHDPTPLLRVFIRWDDHEATIALRGELDIASAPQALQRLAETLNENPQRLVLDLAGLSFMDSQGVKLIVRARQGLPADRQVVVRSPNCSIRRVLRITGMHQVCTIEDSGA